MRRWTILPILLLCFCAMGCTNPIAGNDTTRSHDLMMNQSAIFGKDDLGFTAMIDHFTVDGTNPGSHTVKFTFTVRNTGTTGVSFVANPRIIDSLGTEYTAKGVFLGAINPGGMASGTSSILIPAEGTAAIREHAVPYEVSWVFDPGAFNG